MGISAETAKRLAQAVRASVRRGATLDELAAQLGKKRQTLHRQLYECLEHGVITEKEYILFVHGSTRRRKEARGQKQEVRCQNEEEVWSGRDEENGESWYTRTGEIFALEDRAPIRRAPPQQDQEDDGDGDIRIPPKGMLIRPQDHRSIPRIDFEGSRFRFAVVSDTHLSSKHCKLEELHDFYAKAKAWGAELVFHAGDLDAGEGVYRGQEYELKHVGYDNHVLEIKHHYPNVGMPTYFIIGNHDYVWYRKAGVNIGEDIAMMRKDMIYLGATEGNLDLGGILVRLWHPRGSTAYSLSYKMQRYIEALVPGQKPRLLFTGHYHQRVHLAYRNVDGFLCGCFEGQTLLLKEMGVQPVLGGHLIEIERTRKHNRVELTRIVTEWIPYYETPS